MCAIWYKYYIECAYIYLWQLWISIILYYRHYIIYTTSVSGFRLKIDDKINNCILLCIFVHNILGFACRKLSCPTCITKLNNVLKHVKFLVMKNNRKYPLVYIARASWICLCLVQQNIRLDTKFTDTCQLCPWLVTIGYAYGYNLLAYCYACSGADRLCIPFTLFIMPIECGNITWRYFSIFYSE